MYASAPLTRPIVSILTPPALVLDPALQKYYGTLPSPPIILHCLTIPEYTANRWKYFKWTPRNAWLSFAYMALIPASLAYLGYRTDVGLPICCNPSQLTWQGKYDLRGKRRGDTIAEW